MSSGEIYHHGILGMKWGVRRYQNEDGSLTAKGRIRYSQPKIKKEENSYSINKDGKKVSSINYYDYKLPGFNYVLVSDVDTDPKYRRQGLASNLINSLYNDVQKEDKNKGLYVFVKSNNSGAVKLYNSLDFKYVKQYDLKDGSYYIMAKGTQDTKIFDKYNFS
jgi:ribosomal protein S18 acetylase RimI-like enzyme